MEPSFNLQKLTWKLKYDCSEWSSAFKIDVNENESFINIFERFNNVHFNLSCLTPIKEYLEVNLNDDFHHLPFVFNVISKLNVENKITEAFGVNLKGDFQLTEYSKEDIDNCIVTYLKNRLWMI